MPLNIPQLHSDEALRHQEFPVTQTKIFLAHAGDAALPERVSQAIRTYLDEATQGDQEAPVFPAILTSLRALGAQILGAQPHEIALVGPTSLALSFLAGGLDWQAGDEVLVYYNDYPSNVYPWMALKEKGVTLRTLQTSALGQIDPQQVFDQLTSRTKLVSLASCHYITGNRLDIETVGKGLRERGILFCLDAIQTVGAFPTPVQYVDFLAADSHKWLLGPASAGLLYVRDECQELLKPIVHGWNNYRCPDFLTQPQLQPRSHARKYEAGSYNWLGLVGLEAALTLALEIGIDAIAAELQRKRLWLVEALQTKGYSVFHPKLPPVNTSGIVTFKHPSIDLHALWENLNQQRIITSLRTLPEGNKVIRLSPHYYNTDAELEYLLSLLP